MRPLPLLAALLAASPVVALADPDPAAYARQQQELQRKESRELQKVDQAEQQAHIKIDARRRDETARIQREIGTAAMTTTAAVAATGSTATVNTAKFAELQFAQNEIENLVTNELEPEMRAPFNQERRAINRKFTLERAKLDAEQIVGEDAAKQHDQAIQLAGVNDKYQQQLDDLDLELAAETAKLRRSHTTMINAAERDLAALVAKHVMANDAAFISNPASDPEYNKLAAARDDAKNAVQTAVDELNAKFDVRRTDINNALEDEKAKVTGG